MGLPKIFVMGGEVFGHFSSAGASYMRTGDADLASVPSVLQNSTNFIPLNRFSS
jgi:hypothetical protein